MQSLIKIHYYSKTHRNVKFKPTSWNSTRLILNQMHIFQHKENIYFINIRNFTEFCAINAFNVQYYITLAQTTHTHSVLHNSYSSSYYFIIYHIQYIFFRNINTCTSCWYLKKRNHLTVFNCLSKLFEVDFLKKIRYEHPKPLGSVHL